MTHRQFIEATYQVLASTPNAIFFIAEDEYVAEINGQPFDCESVEEFFELVEFFGEDFFEE
ncbi:MAG: hypothetical protein LIR50_14675 [Bacillota bacterium]|nr:hypothetical protein [Bacillota bacterium]